MRRTTILANEETLQRLRALARERGVSFAHVVREALEEKAGEYRPKPRSLGMFSSLDPALSEKAGVGRTPPR